MYACQIDPLHGKVFEFRLKEGLNIFNAKCKSDLLKLKLYARKNNIDWKKLEKEDWSLLKSKDSIIELIRELGFDGFFDWEWTSNLRKYRENVEGELKGQFLDTSPAVGIFDIEKLKQVQTYQYSDYFEFDDFVKIYNIEKQALKNYAGTLYINEKDLSIRSWICPECGAEHVRDVNAAINLKMNAIKTVGQGVSEFRSVEGVEDLATQALQIGASDEVENLTGDGQNAFTL